MRLIDADAAIESLTEYGNGRAVYIGVEEAVRRIEQLPSAQPEIIRCKDCKYYREYGYVNGKPKFLPKCTFSSIYVNVDDFCSKAERREQDIFP